MILAVAAGACGRFGFDDGAARDAGNADASGIVTKRCPIPARPDTSQATIVTACDEMAIRAAITAGGGVRLDCAGMTVALAAELVVTTDSVLDAAGVTFDGQRATRIFNVAQPARFTLIGGALINGQNATNGGAIVVSSGASLVVYDAELRGNQGPVSGASQGGGAITGLPPASKLEIYGSTFTDNASSNGGAIRAFGDLTIAESVLRMNRATGIQPNGGLGGAIDASGTGNVQMCDVEIASNAADFAGGLHRVSPSGAGTDRLERVHFTRNTAATNAGGAYFEDVELAVRQLEVTSNSAMFVGGLFYVSTKMLDGENVSITDNISTVGSGAGLALGGSPARLAFSTIANNNGSCVGCNASALSGNQNLTLVSSVVVDNTAGSSPRACAATAVGGGNNVQWPTDAPACASDTMFVDPMLAPQADIVGPAGSYRVRRPLADSPLQIVDSGCPSEDLLGNPRPTPCSAGAVEP